jgi:glycosyltransferase involved in cell wall biosynthesis
MRQLERFAIESQYPMLFVRAGKRSLQQGEFAALEIERSHHRLTLDVDFGFDLLIWRHLESVRRELARFRPDVIHITGPGDMGMLGAILAWKSGIPVVASWHTNVHQFAARRLGQWLEWLPPGPVRALSRLTERGVLDLTSLFYRIACHILAPNPEIAQILRERAGRPVSIMSRGIDVDLFDPIRRKRTDDGLLFGYVGRLTPEKNVRLLARIQEVLIREGVRDCRFLFVGDGGDLPWLAERIQGARFTGVLRGEALAEAYAKLDVLMFPSHTDTFGNVVLEAQASGVPVLVTASGGPKFLVDHGRTGWIAGDDDAFVAQAVDIAKARHSIAAMRLESRRAAIGRSWHQVFASLYDVYRSIAAPGLIAAHRAEPAASQRRNLGSLA